MTTHNASLFTFDRSSSSRLLLTVDGHPWLAKMVSIRQVSVPFQMSETDSFIAK
jgi:hypothetical protein